MTTEETRIAVIMGSLSDKKVMQGACDCLKGFSVSYEMHIVSAHRSPQYMQEYALGLEQRGIKVVIAGAGGAAHLPGMVASLTTVPVIGVPIALKHLRGMDSLLSIVSMPKGTPVATVAIDGAFNAGLLAIRIMATHHSHLREKLRKFALKQHAISQSNMSRL
ncbi:MAG: 5-(carboxyamino)imidazole ribonucleotide mutase [Proteobacteria bacterium]|nr:5-(carboxyamino)imidazole ribonucleotide mutase [Pseudomonadota bacterium]